MVFFLFSLNACRQGIAMLVSKTFLVGVLAGAAAVVLAIEATPLRNVLIRTTAFETSPIEQFDHGQLATLRYSPYFDGVRADGVNGRDIENIGFIVRVSVMAPNGNVIEGVEALVDTGADRSFLQGDLIEKLGIRPALQNVSVGEGISSLGSTMSFYDVLVEMPGGARVAARVGASTKKGHQQMLIGRDILAKGMLVFNANKNYATLNFPNE
jgi:hypothetical protein